MVNNKRKNAKNAKKKSSSPKRSRVESPPKEIDIASDASSDDHQDQQGLAQQISTEIRQIVGEKGAIFPRSPPITRSSVRRCGGQGGLSTIIASTSRRHDEPQSFPAPANVTSSSSAPPPPPCSSSVIFQRDGFRIPAPVVSPTIPQQSGPFVRSVQRVHFDVGRPPRTAPAHSNMSRDLDIIQQAPPVLSTFRSSHQLPCRRPHRRDVIEIDCSRTTGTRHVPTPTSSPAGSSTPAFTASPSQSSIPAFAAGSTGSPASVFRGFGTPEIQGATTGTQNFQDRLRHNISSAPPLNTFQNAPQIVSDPLSRLANVLQNTFQEI